MPPQLFVPEWFLRNIVEKELMLKLGERVERFYDSFFEEIIYRVHHNSFKVSFANIFYNDFVSYVVRAYGLKKYFLDVFA